MFKFIALIKRRPELTHEQFRDYMERHHAPFALGALGQLQIELRRYVRNYPVQSDAKSPDKLSDSFDVVVEFWWNSREGYDRFMALRADPVLGPPILNDELKFMDKSNTFITFVEEIEALQSTTATKIALPTDGIKS